jgi:hypothetical protein
MCPTHHRLLTSSHNGALYCSVLPSLMSLIACKIPLCQSCITHIFCTSWSTMFFNLSRNQYQLSPFSTSANAMAKGSNWLLLSAATAVRIVPLYLPVRKCHLCKWPVDTLWKPQCRHPMPRMTAKAQTCLVSPHKDSPWYHSSCQNSIELLCVTS